MTKYLLLALGLIVMMFAAPTMQVSAQSLYQQMYNTGTTHFAADLVTVTATRDTVTDAGSGALLSKRIPYGNSPITIQVNVTKVSGTVAGTLTLSGSLDGQSFKAMVTEETQTAVATCTLTDATNTFTWRLSKNPYRYYKISSTGGTTCVYYLDAFILKQ